MLFDWRWILERYLAPIKTAKANRLRVEPMKTSPENEDNAVETEICIHIFSVSAGLVGVCLTVIGIIQIIINGTKVQTLSDDLLAADALLFLVACVLSYWALRTKNRRRRRGVERIADAFFILGLTLMVAVCAVITYAIL